MKILYRAMILMGYYAQSCTLNNSLVKVKNRIWLTGDLKACIQTYKRNKLVKIEKKEKD